MPNYLDAFFRKKTNEVLVWEKDGDKRYSKLYKAPLYFYYEDPAGEFRSIYNTPLKKIEFSHHKNYDEIKEQMLLTGKRLYESDISPAEKLLMNKYYGVASPKINYSLLDIEVDYSKEKGYARPKNPYAPVNAITIFNQWENKYYTLVLAPKSWLRLREQIKKTKSDDSKSIDLLLETVDSLRISRECLTSTNFIDWIDADLKIKSVLTVCDTEAELLDKVLTILEPSDIISGWNSEFFDLPYLIRRTEEVLKKSDVQRWCLPEARPPEFIDVANRYKEKNLTVRISGRSHIDYMGLFKKFDGKTRPSYRLSNIAKRECPSLPKLQYTGRLRDLYENDFNFFIRYNIRDVEILEHIDIKYRYMDLANEYAHANTVAVNKVLSAVKIIETGIINVCHQKLNKQIPDFLHKKKERIEGALILKPKVGLHEWLGVIDIMSLYPNTMRTMNMSPEMIIGQFTKKEDDWVGIMNYDDNPHELELDAGAGFVSHTGKEWREIFTEYKWAISAFGTVFDQSSGEGMLPSVLGYWYSERSVLKKEKKKWQSLVQNVLENSIKIETGLL